MILRKVTATGLRTGLHARTTFLSSPLPIHTTRQKKTAGVFRRTQDVHHENAVDLPTSRSVTSQQRFVKPLAPFQGPAASCGQHVTSIRNPSALSSSTPGTTRSERTSPHCLARNIARPPGRLLLEPHSHSTAFQSPGFPRQAPGTLPAAAELPALVMVFVLRFTSLSGVTRRAAIVCTAFPSWHRLHHYVDGDFRGPNVEASPYPSMEVFRDLAPSPAKLTGKPLRAFHG